MKRIISFILISVFAFGITVFADAAESSVFYDASTDYAVTEASASQSVYAKLNFTAPKTCTANVIAAHYDTDGTLISATVTDSIEITENETVSYTTPDISLDGAASLKVLIWDSASLTPLTEPAVLSEKAIEFETVFENTEKYIYRVGNKNSVALGSLFKAKSGAEISGVSVTASAVITDTEVSLTYAENLTDWTKGTLQFSGEGPVLVSIKDSNSLSYELVLEIVNATNITGALSNNVFLISSLGSGNTVMLNDLYLRSGGALSVSGATLYGNGFTLDVSAGRNTGGTNSNNYLINLANGSLDNVKIVGEVYTLYGLMVADPYNNPTVRASGNSTIRNCYISNCAAPVRVNDGNLEITNTILKGGNFANLDIRGGHTVLEDVTTINQALGNDKAADGSTVIGLGIVFYYENVPDTTTLEIKGTLTQYNHISDNDLTTFKNEFANQLVQVMLSGDYKHLHLENNKVTWANSGIISMTPEMSDNIIDNRENTAGYTFSEVEFSSVMGDVYTFIPSVESISAPAPDFSAAKQGAVTPKFTYDHSKNNTGTATDSYHCYADADGVVHISVDAENPVFNWNTDVLSASKNGNALKCTAKMNGTDFTDTVIPFEKAGTYTVTYSCIDDRNYLPGENGITAYSEEYTKNLTVCVSEYSPEANYAEFTLGGKETEKITVNNTTYISVSGVSHDNTSWSYMTIGEEQIYYPIIDALIVDGSSSFNAYFPVFDGVVTISDSKVYDYSATEMPETLSAYKGVYKATADVPYWYNLTQGHLSQVGASKIFKYASSSDASENPEVLDGKLYFKSPTISKDRAAYVTLVQYKYTDSTNTTYYYFVGYNLPAHDNPSSCVTGDTLVTLADGSKKRIDEVSYADKLLVWNFYEGSYDAVSPAILFNRYDKSENTVIKLEFSDGTEVKVVNAHQFFDADENKFVNITAESVSSYSGHSFIKAEGSSLSPVKLIGYEVYTEDCKAYGIISAQHYNIFVEGMLSTDFKEEDFGIFNYFTIGENMTFDKALLSSDIEKYGLYTYEDFKDVLTKEQFDAFNVKYMKVAVGKGQYTHDGILELIKEYLN